MHPSVQAELVKQVEAGIPESVDKAFGPTDWISNLVVVPKVKDPKESSKEVKRVSIEDSHESFGLQLANRSKEVRQPEVKQLLEAFQSLKAGLKKSANWLIFEIGKTRSMWTRAPWGCVRYWSNLIRIIEVKDKWYALRRKGSPKVSDGIANVRKNI